MPLRRRLRERSKLTPERVEALRKPSPGRRRLSYREIGEFLAIEDGRKAPYHVTTIWHVAHNWRTGVRPAHGWKPSGP